MPILIFKKGLCVISKLVIIDGIVSKFSDKMCKLLLCIMDVWYISKK